MLASMDAGGTIRSLAFFRTPPPVPRLWIRMFSRRLALLVHRPQHDSVCGGTVSAPVSELVRFFAAKLRHRKRDIDVLSAPPPPPSSSASSSSSSDSQHEVMYADPDPRGEREAPGKPVWAWIRGVPVEDEARVQIRKLAQLPFVHHHVAIMPDVHVGKGSTVGCVLPTVSAVIPAAVGVDIGCGMCAVRTSLRASDLPNSLHQIRLQIEEAIPHGRTNDGGPGDKGAWKPSRQPSHVRQAWQRELADDYQRLLEENPKLERNSHPALHLGTLGTGNHFVEVCLDEQDRVWFMLHSGSRGIGNRVGQYFIELAKEDMRRTHMRNLPDADLAYLREGTQHFDQYVRAVDWAQRYARLNRELMMQALVGAVQRSAGVPRFHTDLEAVNCHHNYLARETHFGAECWVTRKGAVRAGRGELAIIPGSMGARSYIVRGRGSAASFESCSHGAGRRMSRGEARRSISLQQHQTDTQAVECRRDESTLDESPRAYKDIDAVMAAQRDLVEVVHTLRQIICVKG